MSEEEKDRAAAMVLAVVEQLVADAQAHKRFPWAPRSPGVEPSRVYLSPEAEKIARGRW